MSKYLNITDKIVLGTAQLGMDYGITNISGKPNKSEVFNILNLAWKNGVRRFDTAPDYGSEVLLGEFISAHGIQDEIIVLTKIPAIKRGVDFKTTIKAGLELSLKNLCSPIGVLFFHNPIDSESLFGFHDFFENILKDYSVSSLGVSVYEPRDINKLSNCQFDLAFQFPFNILDRRFENVTMVKGKRYSRSIFLQGLLATADGLRPNAPKELFNLQKEYHNQLTTHFINPINFAISFVAQSDVVDYFLLGVESEIQLKRIIDIQIIKNEKLPKLSALLDNIDKKWFDPREWS